VFSVGINAVLNPENRSLMVMVFLIGLFLLNGLGQITLNKIAALRMELAALRMELGKIHNRIGLNRLKYF